MLNNDLILNILKMSNVKILVSFFCLVNYLKCISTISDQMKHVSHKMGSIPKIGYHCHGEFEEECDLLNL